MQKIDTEMHFVQKRDTEMF